MRSRTMTPWNVARNAIAGALVATTLAYGQIGRGDLDARTAVKRFTIKGAVTRFEQSQGLRYQGQGLLYVTASVPRNVTGKGGSSSVSTVPGVEQKTFQFNVDTRSKIYKPGQVAYLDAKGDNVLVTPFPIVGSRRDDLGDHRYMETSITISASGRIDGVTRTWTGKHMEGFTGGVTVFITDKDGNVLYKTKVQKYGVNGTEIPGGASSDRTVNWSEEVPPAVINNAAGYAIMQTPNPNPRWDELLRDTKEGLEAVAAILVIVVVIIATIKGGGGDNKKQ